MQLKEVKKAEIAELQQPQQEVIAIGSRLFTFSRYLAKGDDKSNGIGANDNRHLEMDERCRQECRKESKKQKS